MNGKNSKGFAINISEYLDDTFTMLLFKMFIKKMFYITNTVNLWNKNNSKEELFLLILRMF